MDNQAIATVVIEASIVGFVAYTATRQPPPQIMDIGPVEAVSGPTEADVKEANEILRNVQRVADHADNFFHKNETAGRMQRRAPNDMLNSNDISFLASIREDMLSVMSRWEAQRMPSHLFKETLFLTTEISERTIRDVESIMTALSPSDETMVPGRHRGAGADKADERRQLRDCTPASE